MCIRDRFEIDSWTALNLTYERSFSEKTTLRIGCRNCLDEQPSRFNDWRSRNSGLHDKRGAVAFVRVGYGT